MKAYDLTNQRFGRLIAQYKCNYKKGNKYPWHCICDCGNETDVSTQDLITGKTTSCGCYRKECAKKIGAKTGIVNGKLRAKDLTNQKFGRLIALEPTIEHRGSNIVWKCICSCGNEVKVTTTDLLSGNTQSCGCLKSKGQEEISKLLTQHNISFVTEKIFDNFQYETTKGKPRFDFYIDNKYIIEFDGIQHFENNSFFPLSLKEQKERDQVKNSWCKENNIPLIRIPYWQLSRLKIEDLLLETSEFIIK